jgi:two-component system chemotaxis response regulator CheB
VTLDIEMPDMNGIECLKELRKTHPRLPIIMFSTLAERGAQATVEALTLGASDYVTKPAGPGDVGVAMQRVREQLIPKIKSLCRASHPLARSPDQGPVFAAASGLPPAPARRTAIDIVAIGVSTGGPNALAAIIPAIPGTMPVPIVLVQHMPPLFTKFLAERLNAQSELDVREACGGEELLPGTVYIAPGDYHLVVERRGVRIVTALTQAPPENWCRPSVDVLFRSVAQTYRSTVLAVVLTGMGHDGLRGCEDIARAGGSVFVQDEATSVVWGMPGFVARAGLAERVLPLADVASEMMRRVTAGAPSSRAVPAALAK